VARAWGMIASLLLVPVLAQSIWVNVHTVTWEPGRFPPRRFPACYVFAQFDLGTRPPSTGAWLLTVYPEDGLETEPLAAPELEVRLLRADGTETRWISIGEGARVDLVRTPTRYRGELRACFSGREWPGSYHTRLVWSLRRLP